MAKRRNCTDQFKAKVALEALRGDKTVQEIAAKHQLHPNHVSTCKRLAIDGMSDVFLGGKQSG
ncbi:Transposase [Celeribacter baekdonensis]|uniref:Transposase n=1 Tax=Celeribacter baekdonensis TaxID=875171 RepID=A0A1G7R0C9_9RHOB|nr:transposase [Celeribacter baekdonensis]SDG03589.1 Transposase [Celeribacter baekdonensis]